MSSGYITKLKNYAGLINDILNDSQININTLALKGDTGQPAPLGNTLTVDAVYGNDLTATVGGNHY